MEMIRKGRKDKYTYSRKITKDEVRKKAVGYIENRLIRDKLAMIKKPNVLLSNVDKL